MGLSVSYRIINNHNGEITVDSRLGAGTEFNIRLPLSGILKECPV
ncbi:ATP-binding protein [Paenibacillus sp. AR247]